VRLKNRRRAAVALPAAVQSGACARADEGACQLFTWLLFVQVKEYVLLRQQWSRHTQDKKM